MMGADVVMDMCGRVLAPCLEGVVWSMMGRSWKWLLYPGGTIERNDVINTNALEG